MDRKDFLKNSLIIGGATILPPNSQLGQRFSTTRQCFKTTLIPSALSNE